MNWYIETDIKLIKPIELTFQLTDARVPAWVQNVYDLRSIDDST